MSRVNTFSLLCTDPQAAAEAYQPQPLPVDTVALPPFLAALTERLSENTHEIWSRKRLLSGWTWGPERSDSDKRHPGLVPYACLSEEEKDVDREVTAAVLKGLLALGYKITAPDNETP